MEIALQRGGRCGWGGLTAWDTENGFDAQFLDALEKILSYEQLIHDDCGWEIAVQVLYRRERDPRSSSKSQNLSLARQCSAL
jgi:hypothetical protein